VSVYLWLAIAACISQSGMFSGLNLAIFSVSRLRLEVDAANGNTDAARVLELRRDSNLTLCTVLWGGVAVNVLLTLLSDSALAGGAAAFFFSTFVITFLGEVFPQAYFSRNAVAIAARLQPLLAVYRVLLYPVAKPTAAFLDWWLGPESIILFRERDFRALITRHVEAAETGVGKLEGIGALNFLDLDDVGVFDEGKPLDPRSVVALPFEGDAPVFPAFERSTSDRFLREIHRSGQKWVVITDPGGDPRRVLDAHHFLRDALLGADAFEPADYCHRPIVVSDPRARLGDVIGRLSVRPRHPGDRVIHQDIILAWGRRRRIITGADLLARLLQGIVRT